MSEFESPKLNIAGKWHGCLASTKDGVRLTKEIAKIVITKMEDISEAMNRRRESKKIGEGESRVYMQLNDEEKCLFININNRTEG